MAGAPRITQESVEMFEVLMDVFEKAIADGEITTAELTDYRALKQEVYWQLMHTDTSIAAIVTGIRRGIDAPSFRRRLAERDIRLVHSADEHHDAHIKSALH